MYSSHNHKELHISPTDQQLDNTEASTPEKSIEELKAVVERSNHTWAKASAMFPFDLFPDSITIDRKKLTVIHKTFFNMEQTVSVQLTDLKNVQVDVGPLFGSITVTSEHFINNTQTVRYLPRKKVIQMQRLLQGMIIATNENIDMSEIDDAKLIPLLNKLGQGEVSKS